MSLQIEGESLQIKMMVGTPGHLDRFEVTMPFSPNCTKEIPIDANGLILQFTSGGGHMLGRIAVTEGVSGVDYYISQRLDRTNNGNS